MADVLTDIRERWDYSSNAWQAIRDEAAIDMQYVNGNPWTPADRSARENRPSVAPDELSQYRNQVANGLMSQPRGCKFIPRGNGANDKTARFYQNKWREIEYRSKGSQQYILAADNALQRGYGFIQITSEYASPSDGNQELVIRGFPDPECVTIDPDAKDPSSSDMNFAFVTQWEDQREHARTLGKGSKIKSFAGLAAQYPDWIQGSKILTADYWTINTTKRKLLLVRAPNAGNRQRGVPLPTRQMFEDEFTEWRKAGATVARVIREVDYPVVKMYQTNGLDILDEHDWPGRFIPIVSCYGKVIFVPEGGQILRKILSMTRFMREPWKSYCYACSQQLEVLGLVPKVSLLMLRGQMDNDQLTALEESMHQPKAALTFNPVETESGPYIDKPTPLVYPVGEHLQSLELVKEGFRRAIQSAAGSNFLPTQAQRRNEKSGIALDRIDQMATEGSYHFVYAYEGMIQQAGIIGEDLMDKYYDYTGSTGVLSPDDRASMVRINDQSDPDSYSTKGDHLVTVTTAPSTDSERDAAEEFVQMLIKNIGMVAEIAGPKVAAAIFATGVRMQNLGAMGDRLADLIEPPEFKTQDGEPPNPEVLGLRAQLQMLQQKLQQAGFVIQTKQVDGQVKFSIEQMKQQHEDERAALDREVKLAVATITAKTEELSNLMAVFIEERKRLGSHVEGAADRIHERMLHNREQAQDAVIAAQDRAHEHVQNERERQNDAAIAAIQASQPDTGQPESPEMGGA